MITTMEAAREQEQHDYETQRFETWTAKGFGEAFGVKETTGSLCLRRMVGKQCLTGYGTELCGGCGSYLSSAPGHSFRDHVRGWVLHGKLICLTSEPYDINRQAMEDLMRVEDEFGLHVWVRGDSFHNPGRTTLVMIYPPDHPPHTWAKAER